VEQAVNGLDSVLSVAQEGEKPTVSHPIITEQLALTEEKPASLLN